MSGKYSKNKKMKQNKGIGGKLLLLLVLLVILAGAVLFLVKQTDRNKPARAATTAPEQSDGEQIRETSVVIETVEDVHINLGYGLEIVDVGSYTGIYMEDGSDEIVSGVLMIVVTNNSDIPLQYAEIGLAAGAGNAEFSLSTLPAGASAVVLEKDRMAYDKGADYTSAAARNVALFTEPLSLCEDQLKIQILDGAINVSNISGADIPGDITIYYKNSAADMYYGGITYRVRIEGGLKADELKQIMASHFSDSGSAIMFVTCGES